VNADFSSTLVEEMRDAIRELAGPRDFNDTRESWLARAARKAGISFRQAKAFHYGETPNPRVQDVEKVRAAVRTTQQHTRTGARTHVRDVEERLQELEKLVAEIRLQRRHSGA
jgi:hypothetical protein